MARALLLSTVLLLAAFATAEPARAEDPAPQVAPGAERLARWRAWIDTADEGESPDQLDAERDPELVPLLVAGARDPARKPKVRVMLANLAIRKGHASEVEGLLKERDLAHRVVGFLAFVYERNFRERYLGDASWGVAATVEEWLASDRPDRDRVLDHLEKVFPPPTAPGSLVERLRTFLAPTAEVQLRSRAGPKLVAYRDCASVPALVAATKAETDSEAILRLMQAVLQIWDDEKSPCRMDLPEAEVKAIVGRAFDHSGDSMPDRAVRQRATIHYRRWPAHMGERIGVLRQRLASSPDDIERRVAIEALIAAKDESTLQALPRWIHDDSPNVRSSLVQALPSAPDADSRSYEGLLIGYVRDEPSDDRKGRPAGFFAAVQRLRNAAGEYLGFPAKYRGLDGETDNATWRGISTLWKTGRLEDVTREQVVEAMWRWLAKRNGITDEEAIDEVQKTRAAFWAKVKAGDAAAAKAILEKPAAEKPDLWAYERGWLMKRGS